MRNRKYNSIIIRENSIIDNKQKGREEKLFMNADDSQRLNIPNHGIRKQMTEKYPEKNPNYSPSISYNYSPQTGYNGNTQMHPRRRIDRYRREAPNINDRIIRQNDIIIRLLKEIRDRLPEARLPSQMEEGVSEQAVDSGNEADTWEKEENSKDIKLETPDELPAANDIKNTRNSSSDEETL